MHHQNSTQQNFNSKNDAKLGLTSKSGSGGYQKKQQYQPREDPGHVQYQPKHQAKVGKYYQKESKPGDESSFEIKQGLSSQKKEQLEDRNTLVVNGTNKAKDPQRKRLSKHELLALYPKVFLTTQGLNTRAFVMESLNIIGHSIVNDEPLPPEGSKEIGFNLFNANVGQGISDLTKCQEGVMANVKRVLPTNNSGSIDEQNSEKRKRKGYMNEDSQKTNAERKQIESTGLKIDQHEQWDLRSGSKRKQQTPQNKNHLETDQQYDDGTLFTPQWDDEFLNNKGSKKFILGRVIERPEEKLSSAQENSQGSKSYQCQAADLNQITAALSDVTQLENMIKQQLQIGTNPNDQLKLQEDSKKPNQTRIVKTTDIDVFLRCDEMTFEELEEQQRLEEARLREKKKPKVQESLEAEMKITDEDSDEQEPEWDDVDVGPQRANLTLNSKEQEKINANTKAPHSFIDKDTVFNPSGPLRRQPSGKQWQEQDEAILAINNPSLNQRTSPQFKQGGPLMRSPPHVQAPRQQVNAYGQSFGSQHEQQLQQELDRQFMNELMVKMNPGAQVQNSAQFDFQPQPQIELPINQFASIPNVLHSQLYNPLIQPLINPQIPLQQSLPPFGASLNQTRPMIPSQYPVSTPLPIQPSFNANPFANESFLNFLMSRQNPSRGESKWFYKDPSGVVRGPFSQQQMAQWYEFGYFSNDLEIAYGENSMFLPLHQYKEINMRQSTLGLLPAGVTQAQIPTPVRPPQSTLVASFAQSAQIPQYPIQQQQRGMNTNFIGQQPQQMFEGGTRLSHPYHNLGGQQQFPQAEVLVNNIPQNRYPPVPLQHNSNNNINQIQHYQQPQQQQ